MYFTSEEVKLIRDAAARMPAGGEHDPGKAQLSGLADLAEIRGIDELLMDLEARENNRKFHPHNPHVNEGISRALALVARGMTQSGWEADCGEDRDRFLQRKRANAYRYVNKLRRRRDPGR